MRFLAFMLALAVAGCSSAPINETSSDPLPIPNTERTDPQGTSTSTASPTSQPPKAAGVLPPNPHLNPALYGFGIREDGTWTSKEFTIRTENGLALEIRTSDGSVRCWDMRFNNNERPDPIQAMQFYFATTHGGLPKGVSEGLEFTVMGVLVGTFSCEAL